MNDFTHDLRFRVMRIINKFFSQSSPLQSIGTQYSIAKILLPKFKGTCTVPTQYSFPFVINVDANHELPLKGSPDRNIYYLGTFEAGSLHFFLKLLSEQDTFLDIGAYEGLYSMCASLKLKPANIYAFEPNPPSMEITKKNLLSVHVPSMNLMPFGLGNENTSSTFYPDASHPGSSSFLGDTSNNHAGITVPVHTLDSILQDKTITIMKIDAEGYLNNIIQGATKTISKNLPVIFFEFRQNEETDTTAINLLKSLGYRFFYGERTRHFISPCKEFHDGITVPQDENLIAIHKSSTKIALIYS